ncbi:MAG: thiosulfate oxidation carrier complex protein SoxZ, partial [Hyphomicrobiales bacterium]|nr:thiosulfate oxidation carrier complex protein SoxZ [Hyphomicrobiales bacterium]
SANPYIQFTSRVDESGEFHFIWVDDEGSLYEAKKSISVE